MRIHAVLYGAAWRKVRAKRQYKPLTDELLWHKVYEEYVALLAKHDARPLTNQTLIERHLSIVPKIAGQIAWKRCPKSLGVWAKEAAPNQSHVGLVYELTAFGNLGLFIAADRYEASLGFAFRTYANFWIKKFIRLYLDEIASIVPRTGHMGEDKPRRSVMDIFDAAIEGRRLFRGKAAGRMAVFDGGISIPGPNPSDNEIEVVGTDGPTDSVRLEYLQRHVAQDLFPWVDMGPLFTPRFRLKGHPLGRADDGPAEEKLYELEPEPNPESDPAPNILPAELCYLDSRRTRARYGPKKSWNKPVIGERNYPTTEQPPRLPNTHWMMTDRGWQRGRLDQRPWHKPTYEEHEYEIEIRREDAAALAA